MNRTRTIAITFLLAVGLVSGCRSVTDPHLNLPADSPAGSSGTDTANTDPESDIDETNAYTTGTADAGAGQTSDPYAPNWIDPRWQQIANSDYILSQMGMYELLPSGKVDFYPNTMYPSDYTLNEWTVRVFATGVGLDRLKAGVDHSGVDTTVQPFEKWDKADFLPSILVYPDATWIDAYTVWTTMKAVDLNDHLSKEKPTEYDSGRDFTTTIRTADGTVHWAKLSFIYNYNHWLIADIHVDPKEV